MLSIKNLNVIVEKKILDDISLECRKGEIHIIMGPNGSGKSTFALALMGHPKYSVNGIATLDGIDLLKLTPEKRAKAGLFLSFQHPVSIEGVSVANFIKSAYKALKSDIAIDNFLALLYEKMGLLGIERGFAERDVNVGFSGGEKKLVEMLQLAVLEPKYAILDEPDSGLDIDALKKVASIITKLSPKMGIILITHYNRILKYVEPDKIHLMKDGRIIRVGGSELADDIEEKGYGKI